MIIETKYFDSTENQTHSTDEQKKEELRGQIKISDDVICAIAALTVMEVNGVAGMSSSLTDGLNNLLGIKSLSKGIKVIEEDNNTLALNVYIIVKYGYRVPDIALRIQERVKSSIENNTNFQVTGVNVFIQGLIFDEKPVAPGTPDKL